jgi:hypothetical protein
MQTKNKVLQQGDGDGTGKLCTSPSTIVEEFKNHITHLHSNQLYFRSCIIGKNGINTTTRIDP